MFLEALELFVQQVVVFGQPWVISIVLLCLARTETEIF